MTKTDIDNIIEIICPNDEDFEKPCISPAYLKKELEILALEQEPCDCISRQALDEIKELMTDINGDTVYAVRMSNIRQLPLVTPQPKIGQWLEKEVNSDKVIEEWQSARCSICDKYHTTPYMYYFSHYEYCPHCGSKMEGRQKVDKGRSKRNSRDIHHTERHP